MIMVNGIYQLLVQAHLLRGVLPRRQPRESQREPGRQQSGEDGVRPRHQHPGERQQEQEKHERRLRGPRLPVHQDRRERPCRHEQEQEHCAHLVYVLPKLIWEGEGGVLIFMPAVQ